MAKRKTAATQQTLPIDPITPQTDRPLDSFVEDVKEATETRDRCMRLLEGAKAKKKECQADAAAAQAHLDARVGSLMMCYAAQHKTNGEQPKKRGRKPKFSAATTAAMKD